MDLQVEQIAAGFVLGVFTEFLRHRLSIRASKQAEERARRQRVREEAYAPAIQTLSNMIEAYPNHAEERKQLRELFRTRAAQFDAEDAEHLWVALTDAARLDDLRRVRILLEESLSRKAG